MTQAVRAGALIDGTGAEARRAAVIDLDGDTIVGVDDAAARDADVIDCSDLTVMPGMIDCHVHLWESPSTLQERLNKPYSLRVAEAFRNARTTLDAGFTTVRDAGGTPRGVKQAIERGMLAGPHLRISVGWLSQTGGHGDFCLASGISEYVEDPEHPCHVADGVDGVRKAARLMLRAGADQIKICTSGGVLSPTDEPTATGFSPEEIAAVVYEAHAAGKTVMSHAQSRQGIRNAVEAGVESIEHGIYLDEETAVMMKERGTYLVPTLVAAQWVLRRAERDPASIPDYALRKVKEILDVHREMFRMALAMGVPIAMGTDSGVGEHGTNAEELELMVQLGMTPMQAIVATTRTAAECSRVDHLTGTIEPGKRGDLIAVDGDPLSDISILGRAEAIKLVVRSGEIVRDDR